MQPPVTHPHAQRRVLMIAYHFPPLAGSSGIQRTLRFVQQLPDQGWTPIVLTADARAYERTSDDLLAEVPADVTVCRAFALDAARHLRIGGRYAAWMARPDRWTSWRFDAVRKGMQLIARYRPSAIWSTYPIPTAHVIASALHRRSGLPWVADFRDPMAQHDYPADPSTRKQYLRIEQCVMAEAASVVFTTPGAARMYRERYGERAAPICVIENGYDEESFTSLTAPQPAATTGGEKGITLLHSGIVYPSERDPSALFGAVRLLRERGHVAAARLRLRFRAAVHDDLLSELATRNGVADVLELCPPVPYREALREMVSVDSLLVLQAANCNEQIPAKLYEYLRAGRPIVGLTDPAGDTAAALTAAGVPYIGRLDDEASIAGTLARLLDDLAQGRAALPAPAAVARASRQARTAELAQLLGRVTGLKQPGASQVPAHAHDR